MAAKLALGPGPIEPEKKPATKPTGSSISTDYRDVSGISGFNGQNHILQSDNQSCPGIALQTVGDIYLNADVHMQLYSKTCNHEVDTKLLQYFKDVERNISGENKETIDGTNTVIVNNDSKLTVTGLYTENINLHDMIIQNQHVTVSGEQVKTIHGIQDLKVGLDQTQHIGGNKTVDVDGDYTLHAIGTTKIKGDADMKWLTLGHKEDVTLGNNFKLNVGAREDIRVGATEDIRLGFKFEQLFSVYHTKNCSVVIDDQIVNKTKKEIVKNALALTLLTAKIKQENLKINKIKPTIMIVG